MQFLQALVDGILLGGVYAVISIGLTLVFGVVSIVNFAQGEFLMVGMYVAYFAWRLLGLDPLAGAVLSFMVAFALGVLVQKFLINRVLGAPAVAQIFLTVGLLIVMENLALMLFGSEFRSVQTPYQMTAFSVGPLLLSAPYLLAFCVASVSGFVLWWVLKKTWWGMAVRATAQDPMAARLYGISTQRVHQLAFGLGVGLTALGGGIILPYLTASPTVGSQFSVLMFTAVVLGGLGSVMGAVVGGIAVGVIQSLSSLFLPMQLQNLVLFAVFILVLAFRPEGLLKKAGS
ncbi:branched-chain amino acid ABC transporter permease (plasmid) [Diaphorobacter sp. HDW4B]|uniref:branched-chain amino acid ABC transporter permease n=1 Tax=Diaphorobacter sp. HDW4B TaxID=2714925 RepID=UPI00140CFBB7|nr:branched-chain amino acid ABC transporter permease [Diaphorobacter sp. HDW4B]QIL74174.1 branched-chain amino acid ABC transporter permease [Diaphorobacter sp. HDW4B]